MERLTNLIFAAVLCALLILPCRPSLRAQGAFTITPYTVRDGLPSTNLRILAEDADGFIWCGTEEGLIRFDGYGFRTFRGLGKADDGLADNRIMALRRDSKGRLWVATGRALHRYEPLTQTFHRYPYTRAGGEGPAAEWVEGMFETADSTLWILSNLGISWYRDTDNTFDFIRQQATKPALNDQAINHVEEGRRIWFISNGTLFVFDRSDRSILPIQKTRFAAELTNERRFRGVFHDPSRGLVIVGFRGVYLFRPSTQTIEEIHSIKGWATGAARGRRAVWISLADGSLLRYDISRGDIEHIPAVPEFHFPHLDNTPALRKLGTAEPGTRTMFVDREDVLWIAFQNRGLLRYDHARKSYRVLGADMMKNSVVQTFLQDHNGTLWLAVPGRALVHIEEQSHRFPVHTLTSRQGTPSLVPWNNVRGFLEWNRDSVFVASLSGLFVYHRGTAKTTPLTGLPPEIARITTKAIWSLARDGKGRLWIGTGGDGLLVYDPHSRDYLRFSAEIGHPYPLIDQRIRVIHITPRGKAILGTWSGACTINADSLELTSPRPVYIGRLDANAPKGTNGQSIELVMAAETDKRGRLWIGTDNGLSMTDPASGQRKQWRRGSPRSTGLISDDIRAILQDRGGNLWIGTHGAGLQRFSETEGVLEVVDMEKGLPDNIVYSIEEDSHGQLWLGTHRGLCRYNPATAEVRNYDESDGLQNYEFNTGASLRLFDGALLFGGVAGFNLFYPDSIHDRLGVPNVAITRLLVQEKDRAFSLAGIELSHDQNYITFEYAALSHYRNAENHYAHMLVGIDNSWVHTDTRRYAAYSNLPPGDYVFRVIACNSEGRWNTVGASIPVTISPAWWKSTPAIAAYAVSIFVLIVVFVRIQRRRATQREHIRGEMLTAEYRAQTAEAQAKVLSAANDMKELELRRTDELRAAYDELARAHEDLKKLSQAVHQSPAIVIITDTTGAIEYVNPKFTEVTGYKADEVVGKNPRLLKSDDSPESLYRQLWKTLSSGSEWRGELKNRRRDGSSYWVLSSISPLKGNDGAVTHYIGIQEDITMRKETEEILARRNEELETIDRIVEILNWEFDFERLVRSLLEQGLKLLPQAKQIRIFIHEPSLHSFVLADAIGMESEMVGTATFSQHDLLQGYVTTCEIADHGISILRESNSADNETDQQSGSVLLMSVRFDRARDEEDGYVVFDVLQGEAVFGPDDARRLIRYREHAITALAKARTLQTLKERNDELLRTQEQLVVQQKLASLGQLTAGIAHEIRNPLNFINNFALTARDLAEELQIAIDIGNDPAELLSELRLATEKIHEHGSRADRIVGSMLLHARSQRGEKQDTAINRLVQDAIHLAYHGMRAKIPEFHVTLKNEFDPDVTSLRIVPQEVSRVILSLLDNAFYAVLKRMESKSAPEGYIPTVKASTFQQSSHVEIRIWDNGGGMPQDVRERIFDPFFTTKPAGEGTGLGLSLSHDIIVKEHEGSMEVESRDGDWTAIIIQLPSS